MAKWIEKDDGNQSGHWRLAPVLAGLVLAWIVLGWPWLSGSVTIPWDAKAHFQPQIQFLAQSIWRGESPFWAPFVFSGHAQIADPQSMIFSPPFLALAALNPSPGLTAVDTTVLAAILVSAFAVVLWCRDRGWHWSGALIAALAFAFGASMAWRIQHIGQVLSLAYFPIVLLLLSRALARGSLVYGLAAGVVAAFLVLGRDQVALLSVYVLVAYVVLHWIGAEGGADAGTTIVDRIRHSLVPLFAGATAGVAIIAIPVAMTLLATADSNRPAIGLFDAGRGSLHPALLITLFAPDVFGSKGQMVEYWGPPSFAWKDTGLFIAQNMGQLYIGAIPITMLLIGLFSGTLFRRDIRFFTIAAAVMLIYALGWYTPVFGWMHALVPGVDLYRRPADATFLIGYFTALMAGYTTHRLFAEPLWQPGARAIASTIAVVAVVFASVAGLAWSFARIDQTLAPFLIALAIFAGAAITLLAARRIEPLRPLVAAILPFAFTVGDLAWSNGPGGATALPLPVYEVLEPSSKNETIALLKRKVAETASPDRRDRVELIGLGFHWPNAALPHRLETTLGYNPLRLATYSAATGAHDTAGSPEDRWFVPLFPSYKTPLANLLGLRFIAAGAPIETIDKTLKPGDLPLVARTAEGYIYENKDALPRVLYVPEAKAADFAELIAKGGLAGDFTRTVLLEPEAIGVGGPAGPGTARLARYRNTEVVVDADGGGGWLVLNDPWHPWWEAEVDGHPAPLLKANVLFRAVRLEPGRHQVRFVFRPLRGTIRQLAEWRRPRN